MRHRNLMGTLFLAAALSWAGPCCAAQAGNEGHAKDPYAAWIGALDDSSFEVREEAAKKLREAGEPARAALERAWAAPASQESKSRVEEVLAALDLDALSAEDIETFLQARKRIVLRGAVAKDRVLKAREALAPGSRMRLRLDAVLADFEQTEGADARLRVVDAAVKAFEQRRKDAAPEERERLALMVNQRYFLGACPPALKPYAQLYVFDFDKGRNDSSGAATLTFDITGNLLTRPGIYAGQALYMKDLGAADYDAIKAAPAQAEMEQWPKLSRAGMPCVTGHVYLFDCKIPARKLDCSVKFQPLEVKKGEWLVFRWERLPVSR